VTTVAIVLQESLFPVFPSHGFNSDDSTMDMTAFDIVVSKMNVDFASPFPRKGLSSIARTFIPTPPTHANAKCHKPTIFQDHNHRVFDD